MLRVLAGRGRTRAPAPLPPALRRASRYRPDAGRTPSWWFPRTSSLEPVPVRLSPTTPRLESPLRASHSRSRPPCAVVVTPWPPVCRPASFPAHDSGTRHANKNPRKPRALRIRRRERPRAAARARRLTYRNPRLSSPSLTRLAAGLGREETPYRTPRRRALGCRCGQASRANPDQPGLPGRPDRSDRSDRSAGPVGRIGRTGQPDWPDLSHRSGRCPPGGLVQHAAASCAAVAGAPHGFAPINGSPVPPAGGFSDRKRRLCLFAIVPNEERLSNEGR